MCMKHILDYVLQNLHVTIFLVICDKPKKVDDLPWNVVCEWLLASKTLFKICTNRSSIKWYMFLVVVFWVWRFWLQLIITRHPLCILSYIKSIACSKASSPHNTNERFLFQFPVSPFFHIIIQEMLTFPLRLPVTALVASIFLSVTCCRRQFLFMMWV